MKYLAAALIITIVLAIWAIIEALVNASYADKLECEISRKRRLENDALHQFNMGRINNGKNLLRMAISLPEPSTNETPETGSEE